jgi:hypothetical protein
MAMTWYRLELQEGIEAEVDFAWRAAWKVAHEQDRPDSGHAVFRASNGSKGVILYFSPLEQTLAETFGAKPCAKPSLIGLRLVAGHRRALQTYFPDAVQNGETKPETTRAPIHFQPSKIRRAFAPTHPFDPTHPSQPAPL